MTPVYWHLKCVGFLPSESLRKDAGIVSFALPQPPMAVFGRNYMIDTLGVERVDLQIVDQNGESAFRVVQYADLAKLRRIRGFVPEDTALPLLYPQI